MSEILLTGIVLDEQTELSLEEVMQACVCDREWIMALVEQGVIDVCTEFDTQSNAQWRFSGECLRVVRIATRLRKDLGLDAVGAALAVELMREIDSLRARLAQYE